MSRKNQKDQQQADISDLDYYKSQPDYDRIKDYLDTSPTEEALDLTALPQFKPDYSNAIVVDNLPMVNEEKKAKLMAVLLKIFGKITSSITQQDIYMPLNPDTGNSYGFCFIKFTSKEFAAEAIKVTNGFALDKNHVFIVNSYNDLETFNKINESDTLTKLPEFNPRPDTISWLSDPKGRDQFVIRYGFETEIYWSNTTGEEPSKVYGGEREKQSGKFWTELFVEWSPQGTYLATFHKQGVKLWGGGQFQPSGRFSHIGVEEINFSPCENYVITYKLTGPTDQRQDPIIVWDVRTGEQLRSFTIRNPLDARYHVQATVIQEDKTGKKIERIVRGRVKSYEDGFFSIEEGNIIHENVPMKSVQALQEPNRLKWSHDGKYVARVAPDLIYIYELPSMLLLEKKSLAAKDVIDFVWSPRSNLISYISPAAGNYPAIVNIVKIPERDNLCSRKFFDVSDGKMVWQNDGEYLCVYLVKMQGKKKSYVVVFFRVKDAGIPVEQIELSEPILNIVWEPSGDKVAILTGDARSPSVSFYSMSNQVVAKVQIVPGAAKPSAPPAVTVRAEVTHLFTKTGIQCNDLQWSPAGGVIAVAYFASDACIFELLDVENNVTFATRRHDRCGKLLWDPSGRYLATSTITELRNSHVKGNPEDGVNFYNFQGQLLCQAKKEKVFSFSWRPRPRDIFTPEEKKRVLKNIKKYEKAFEKEDRLKKQELTQELQAARFKAAEEFLVWMNRNRAISANLKPRRIALRNGYDSDDERNYEIELITA